MYTETCKPERSIYQIESDRYYSFFREYHTKIHSFNKRKVESEINERRYSEGNIKGIKNLGTFISVLRTLLKARPKVKGIDLGCGNHFFISHTYKNFGWDVKGFDSDRSAIAAIRSQYPLLTDRFFCHDILQPFPIPDQTQDFVFCNAVIQHFSDSEVARIFREVHRILKPEGVFLLIFKRNVKNWREVSEKMWLNVKIMNKEDGKIELLDPVIKEALKNFSPDELAGLCKRHHDGFWLLHFFSVDKIINLSEKNNFRVIENTEFEQQLLRSAIFTYLSGRRVPCAAIFFQKKVKE